MPSVPCPALYHLLPREREHGWPALAFRPYTRISLLCFEKIRDSPLDHVQQLRGSPFFKLRVGNCRVILDIRKKVMIVYMVKVGKRENTYENV